MIDRRCLIPERRCGVRTYCGIRARDIDNRLSPCRQRPEPQVRSTPWKMLVANKGARTKFHQHSEQMRGRIRAARMVANIFFERFFATIRVHYARFDDYLRHWPTVLF